jgi:hypothetical protein
VDKQQRSGRCRCGHPVLVRFLHAASPVRANWMGVAGKWMWPHASDRPPTHFLSRQIAITLLTRHPLQWVPVQARTCGGKDPRVLNLDTSLVSARFDAPAALPRPRCELHTTLGWQQKLVWTVVTEVSQLLSDEAECLIKHCAMKTWMYRSAYSWHRGKEPSGTHWIDWVGPNRSGRRGKDRSLAPTGTRTLTPRPSSP